MENTTFRKVRIEEAKNQNTPDIKLNVKIDGVEEALRKVNEFIDKLEEAKSLANDLASLNFEVTLN